MPQKMIAALALAYLRATVRMMSGVDAADRLHRLRRERREMRLEPLEPFGMRLDVLHVVEPLGDDHIHHRIKQRARRCHS